MDLNGKHAIITGISKGIGKALAQQLLDKGAHVTGWGLHEPGYTHPKLNFFKTDMSNIKEVEKAFENTMTVTDGHIHILVNNAGLGYFGYIEDIKPEEFDEIFKVNVYGLYYACRVAVPVMKRNKYGHIINLSSVAGLEGQAQVSAYCGAKHAVKGISESLFKELRDFGIKVTAIYPGSTKTDFFRHSDAIKPHDNMMKPEEVAAQIVWVLETSDNFAINNLEFRPLQPRPAK